MKSHQDFCSFKPISCIAIDVGCDWKGKQSEMNDHQKNCQWILMRIPLLKVYYKYSLTIH